MYWLLLWFLIVFITGLIFIYIDIREYLEVEQLRKEHNERMKLLFKLNEQEQIRQREWYKLYKQRYK